MSSPWLTIRSILLQVTIAISSGCRAWAVSSDDILFYAPFDGSAGAKMSLGSPKPLVSGKAEFAPGKYGQGYLSGRKGDELQYESNGNLDPDAGTVSLWVKPLGWHEKDAFMRFWLRVGEQADAGGTGEGTFLWLYKYLVSVPLYWLAQQVYYQRSVSYCGGSGIYRSGEWTHIAASWCGPMMRVYANGRLLGTARTPTPRVLRNFGKHFMVGGASWTAKGDTSEKSDSLIDEFYVFRRPLTAREVRFLMAKGPDALDQKESVRPAALEIESVFLPSKDELQVRLLVTGRRPGDTKGLTTVFSLENVNDARPAIDEPIRRPVSEVNSSETLSTKELPPARYRVLAALLNNGELCNLVSADFVKPELPAWLGTRLGIPVKPPDPWTAITQKGQTLECWSRQVQYDNSLFPVRMSSRNQELLARPIRLVARLGGKEVEASEARFTWNRVTELRVDFLAEVKFGALPVKVTGWMEYDGFLWTELTIPAAAGQRIEGLRLEIPMRSDVATLQHGHLGGWHKGPNNGKVHAWNFPLEGQPFLWLGNEEVGLQWCTEDNYCWENKARDKTFQLKPGEKECLFTVTLIDDPIPLDNPLAYTFGLQATPVKPMPQGWRAYDLGMNGQWRRQVGQGEPKQPTWAFWYQKWNLQNEEARKDRWQPGYPAVGPWTKEVIAGTAAENAKPFLYPVPSWVWRGAPEYHTFHGEWNPDSPPGLPPETTGAQHSGIWRTVPSYQDWHTWRWWKTLKDNPWLAEKTGGIYNDVVQAFWGPDPKPDRHGLVRTRHELLGARDIQQRMYVLFQKEWPHIVISNHQSADTHMSQLAFAHVYVTGENYAGNATLGKEESYYHIMDLDSCRAELTGEKWGIPIIFLPEIQPSGAPFARVYGPEGIKPAEHLAGLLLVHDVIPWPANTNPVPMLRLAALKENFGWDDETQFVGYWKSSELAKLETITSSVVLSIYRRPGKVMFVLMNNSDEDAKVVLTPDWARLGVAAPQELIDAYTATGIPNAPLDLKLLGGEGKIKFLKLGTPAETVRLPVTDGRLRLTVEKRNFRALVAG